MVIGHAKCGDDAVAKKFMVIDQNYLRDSHLEELLALTSDFAFVLPDVALMEMCKSNLWKTTMNRSLKILSGSPRKVHVSIGISEAFKFEVSNYQSVNGHLFNREITRAFRDLLNEVALNKDGERIEAIDRRIVQVQENLRKDELNDNENKIRLKKMMDLLKLTPESLKDLRANRIAQQDKLSAIKEYAPLLLEEFFRQAGFPKNKARRFLNEKPMILRFMYSRIWLCLNWKEKGGLETVVSEKITNDYLDHDYILTATFFDGILSKDKRVNEAYRDISSLIS